MCIKKYRMESLLGKWRLLKNEGFDNFLKFTQVPWYKRKIAGYCSIDLEILKDGHTYEKRVHSRFYKTVEKIIFGNNYITSGTTRKKYSYENGAVYVDVLGSIVNWKEVIYYDEPNLVVEYNWTESDGTVKTAKQTFKP